MFGLPVLGVNAASYDVGGFEATLRGLATEDILRLLSNSIPDK